MTSKAQYCGEFYTSENGQNVGAVYKIGNMFVIRGIAAFSGKILWESAPFTAKQFKCYRKFAGVNYYTAA